MNKRPTLYNLFIFCTNHEYKEKGLSSLLPWWFASCFFMALACNHLLASPLENRSDYLSLISGLISAQGIMIGMSTNAIQHIIQNISEPRFSAYLKDNQIMPFYLFFIQFFQIIGIVALLLLIASATTLLAKMSDTHIRWTIIASLTFLFYSLKQTTDMASMLKDIVYYKSIFDTKYANKKQHNIHK